MYRAFNTILRQELVAALVNHLVSPHHEEVDCALFVLTLVSHRETFEILNGACSTSTEAHLFSFISFLKSILEDVRDYSDIQLRSIFRIMFECALAEGSRSRILTGETETQCSSASKSDTILIANRQVVQYYYPTPQDDIMIFLRKHLTSVDPAMRKIALIGSCAYFHQVCYCN